MPNGKPHDNPLTDLLVHGMHPFPPDIEEMIRELHDIDPAILHELGVAPFDWEAGKYLDGARSTLGALLRRHAGDK
jgi:hypothetical protein